MLPHSSHCIGMVKRKAVELDIMEHPDSIRNDVDSNTLSRVVMNNTKNADLTLLMGSIATASKLVSRSIRKAGIAGLFGVAGSSNATGDDQKKLDVSNSASWIFSSIPISFFLHLVFNFLLLFFTLHNITIHSITYIGTIQ
jgi:hypothetical protein